jgi:hypothetical protein
VIQGFREGAQMNQDQFWPTDEQFSKIVPHRPTDTQGKERVDDRRVIGGIVRVLKSGRPLSGRCARLRAQDGALQSHCALGGQGRPGGPV